MHVRRINYAPVIPQPGGHRDTQGDTAALLQALVLTNVVIGQTANVQIPFQLEITQCFIAACHQRLQFY